MTKYTTTNDYHPDVPFKIAPKIVSETTEDGVEYYICENGKLHEKKSHDKMFKVEKIKMKGKYYQGQNPDRTRAYLED